MREKKPYEGMFSYTFFTCFKRCGKYGFAGVMVYWSNIIFLALGFVYSCNLEADLLADTTS